MDDKDVRDLSSELPEEPANFVPEPVSEVIPAAMVEETPKKGWNRRKFLTAAALGTAAAAMLSKGGSNSGFSLGPLTALADDHSTDPCTAGDIDVSQTGIIINEPCTCSGSGSTFNAV